jgi:hypothetical protein
MLPFLAMGAAVYGMAVDNMQAVQRALLFYPDPQRPDPGRWGAADFELVGTPTTARSWSCSMATPATSATASSRRAN